MNDRYSIAQARDRLPRLIHRLEAGGPIEITRRGKPVAVLLSADEYSRLSGGKPKLGDFIKEFRERYDLDRNGLGPDEMTNLRDPSPGREFSW